MENEKVRVGNMVSSENFGVGEIISVSQDGFTVQFDREPKNVCPHYNMDYGLQTLKFFTPSGYRIF